VLSNLIAVAPLKRANFQILNSGARAPIAVGSGPTKEEGMNVWSNEKYCDLANLILGAVLFSSLWIFGFAAGHQSQNAWVTGIVIAILSIAALAAFAVREE
jgi:hypothetical protein